MGRRHHPRHCFHLRTVLRLAADRSRRARRRSARADHQRHAQRIDSRATGAAEASPRVCEDPQRRLPPVRPAARHDAHGRPGTDGEDQGQGRARSAGRVGPRTGRHAGNPGRCRRHGLAAISSGNPGYCLARPRGRRPVPLGRIRCQRAAARHGIARLHPPQSGGIRRTARRPRGAGFPAAVRPAGHPHSARRHGAAGMVGHDQHRR